MRTIKLKMKSTILKSTIVIILTLVIGLGQACNNGGGKICTEEFRMISVTVIGAELDEYYTLRNKNGDTIRLEYFQKFGNTISYPVLDDSFQSSIANKNEEFTFVGIIDDKEVINEPYVIGADECHIDKVSGTNEINLLSIQYY